jgi:hypothetical protein
MNSVANQLRNHLQLFVATVLLLMLPFVAMVPRVMAMDDHAMYRQSDAALDCATACAQAMNTPPPTTVIKEDEARTPDPEPQEIIPYHLQFQTIPVPKKLRPPAVYDSMPARPPDIVKLSGHFLF